MCIRDSARPNHFGPPSFKELAIAPFSTEHGRLWNSSSANSGQMASRPTLPAADRQQSPRQRCERAEGIG
eukprot:15212463-Alexandrium_andersonii.AAC.1